MVTKMKGHDDDEGGGNVDVGGDGANDEGGGEWQ